MSDDYDRKHEHFLHSDRIAAEIGLSALKTIIVLNAGSLVALLAFVGQVWNNNQGQQFAAKIMNASCPFTTGLALGGISFVGAYLYQLTITALRCWDMQPDMARIDGWIFSRKTTRRTAAILQVLMIFLALLSFGCFIYGMREIGRIIGG